MFESIVKYTWLFAIYLFTYATLSFLVGTFFIDHSNVFTEIAIIQNYWGIITALITLFIIIYVNRKPPLNDRYFWASKDISVAAVYASIGHIGFLFSAYLLYSLIKAGSGSGSGLMFLPLFFWMFIFYLLAMVRGGKAAKTYMKK